MNRYSFDCIPLGDIRSALDTILSLNPKPFIFKYVCIKTNIHIVIEYTRGKHVLEVQ